MNVAGPFRSLFHFLLSAGLLLAAGAPVLGQQGTTSPAEPLLHPSGVAIEVATGSIYFAEGGAHRVRRLTIAGTVETVAGTGIQGFGGDGGPAILAQLNSPEAVALSAAGDLFVADTGNQRIRKVSLASGIITTIAGSNTAGFRGEGSSAALSLLSHPRGLTCDAKGNLVIADTGNQRIRMVDATTSSISTLAGTGVQGFSGDGGPGVAATLSDPAAVVFDGLGNLYIADGGNDRVRVLDPASHRLRTVLGGEMGPVHSPSALALASDGQLLVAEAIRHRVLRADLVTGSVTVLAGAGAQAFAGDGAAAASALLDSPAGLALTPEGSLVIADSGNNRLRRVSDTAGPTASIWTIAGVGAQETSPLRLSGPDAAVYGSGVSLSATASGNNSAGKVTLRELAGVSSTQLAEATLVQGSATFQVETLSAGVHRLIAGTPGDAERPASTSNVLIVTVTPLAISALPRSETMLFGQTPPILGGSLVGLLAKDSGAASAVFGADVSANSPPGVYPIRVTLVGSAAPNYVMITTPGAVMVSKAPATLSLLANGTPPVLVARAVAATSGSPTGMVSLSDGSLVLPMEPAGIGQWTVGTSQLSPGAHHLTATYSGDQNFLAATSSPIDLSVPGSTPTPPDLVDFSMSVAENSTSVSVPAGTAAAILLKVTPINGQLAGPVALAASGLPAFATASFDPPVLPPGDGVRSFTLHIATAPVASTSHSRRLLFPLVCALMMPLGWWRVKGRRLPLMLAVGWFTLLLPLQGCGDRVNATGAAGSAHPVTTYNVLVTATTTSADGRILQHTATVQMQVIN